VRDDNVNTFTTVVYALREVCDLKVAEAVERMWAVHHHGSARLVSYTGQEQAETTAARLQALGLHATVEAG
jgi:ATP-dependent Clp protease adapter protein ClpS